MRAWCDLWGRVSRAGWAPGSPFLISSYCRATGVDEATAVGHSPGLATLLKLTVCYLARSLGQDHRDCDCRTAKPSLGSQSRRTRPSLRARAAPRSRPTQTQAPSLEPSPQSPRRRPASVAAARRLATERRRSRPSNSTLTPGPDLLPAARPCRSGWRARAALPAGAGPGGRAGPRSRRTGGPCAAAWLYRPWPGELVP